MVSSGSREGKGTDGDTDRLAERGRFEHQQNGAVLVSLVAGVSEKYSAREVSKRTSERVEVSEEYDSETESQNKARANASTRELSLAYSWWGRGDTEYDERNEAFTIHWLC